MTWPGFDQPRLAINRVYTRRGDAGQTSLAGGQRLPKNDLRIEAYGTVDELNSFIGLARESARELPELDRILRRVQHELFNLGSILATLPEDVHPKQARITAAESEQLEREIDRMNEGLAAAAIVRSARRLAAQRRTSHLPHRLPPRRTRLRFARWQHRSGRGNSEIPEPAQRCAVRLEPLGQPSARRWPKHSGSRTRRRRKRYHRRH